MKHFKVTHETELNIGDFVIVNNRWAEIYKITVDHGIITSVGTICRTILQKDYQPNFSI